MKKILITRYKPQISIENGIIKFIEWYKDYYKIRSLLLTASAR